MKYIFNYLVLTTMVMMLSACGEKTPEEIAADNKKNIELAVKRAQVMMFDGDYQGAATLLENTSAKSGQNVALCESLAYAYAKLDRPSESAIFFEKASDLSGGNPQMLISSAKTYIVANQINSAIGAYSKYVQMVPRDAVAWKNYAKLLEKQDRNKDALNAYLEFVKTAGRATNTDEASDIGWLFLKSGNVVQAQRWLEAALGASIPENVNTRKSIFAGLVAVYLSQKEASKLDYAVAEIDKIDPEFISQKYPDLRKKLDEFRKSMKELQDALKAEEKRKEEEAKAKEEAEAKAKEEAEAKAKEEAAKKAEEEAKKLEEEKKAKEENTEPTAENNSEKIPQQQEGEIIQTELKDETGTPQVELTKQQKLIAQVYQLIADGKASEASKIANMAVAEDRNSSEAWRALGLAYDAEGRGSDSYMAAKEAYTRNPEDINATLLYLRTASHVQNNEQFLNSLYRAREKFPNNYEIMIGLARTYKLIGDKPNSKFFYHAFLNSAPQEHPLYNEVSEEFEKFISSK